jgi:hypothetical protein
MAITFTPDDVVAAYRRHPEYRPGIRANVGRRKDSGELGCCPLSILIIDSGGRPPRTSIPEYDDMTDDEGYGFVAAVDRRKNWPIDNEERRRGWALGRRVLHRLAAEGMLSPKLTAKVLTEPEPE